MSVYLLMPLCYVEVLNLGALAITTFRDIPLHWFVALRGHCVSHVLHFTLINMENQFSVSFPGNLNLSVTSVMEMTLSERSAGIGCLGYVSAAFHSSVAFAWECYVKP